MIERSVAGIRVLYLGKVTSIHAGEIGLVLGAGHVVATHLGVLWVTQDLSVAGVGVVHLHVGSRQHLLAVIAQSAVWDLTQPGEVSQFEGRPLGGTAGVVDFGNALSH